MESISIDARFRQLYSTGRLYYHVHRLLTFKRGDETSAVASRDPDTDYLGVECNVRSHTNAGCSQDK